MKPTKISKKLLNYIQIHIKPSFSTYSKSISTTYMYVCVSVYMYICSVSNKEEGEEVSVTKDQPPLAPKKASTPSTSSVVTEYIICSDRDVHDDRISVHIPKSTYI